VIREKCSKCGGAGRYLTDKTYKVKIPAGIDTGNSIRVTGAGGAGAMGAPAGDLYVVIEVNDHETFRREGDDLVTEMQVEVADAVLGARKPIADILGDAVDVDIPQGAQPDELIQIRGRGMPKLQSRGRGDLWVQIKVRIPMNLSRKEKKIYEELKELSNS
jgi:molecular chaperone DnaJ